MEKFITKKRKKNSAKLRNCKDGSIKKKCALIQLSNTTANPITVYIKRFLLTGTVVKEIE